MKNGIEKTQGKLAVVILAAGKGTRLKSQRPKVLHEIGGRPLIRHVIAAASSIAPPEQIYVVIGHQAETVRAAVAPAGVRFVEQTEQHGTGHALQCARAAIAGYESLLVLSGDVPLICPETLENLWRFHQAEQAAMTILSTVPKDPTGYGRILRRSPGAPEVEAIIEQKALTAGQQSLREINSGIYVFRTVPLLAHLDRLTADNANREVILTDMAGLLRAAGERVVALEAAGASEVLGANTIAELVALDAALRQRTAERLMAQGVTIFRPETSVIDAEVEVAPDTVIEPFVQLLGRTRIGSNCRIRSYAVIEDCTLGDGVLIRQSSVLSESTVANGASIGPFAHLRPGCEIGEDVHIGNFVETKKARLGKGAKAGHLTYLGDAEVGAGTNIGAGTITCNYDGVNKHPTRIGRDAFVGSDSTLVAPVTIGDGAYL
ncbi:MAG: bifunctional UDP-N-acetylglucosamine diphosphorylase/glucosamine-1-phosphate N-acetyltransferase GlmU, partial [Terracidiphilus sp.]